MSDTKWTPPKEWVLIDVVEGHHHYAPLSFYAVPEGGIAVYEEGDSRVPRYPDQLIHTLPELRDILTEPTSWINDSRFEKVRLAALLMI